MKSIVIIGAGGVAKGVYQIIHDINAKQPTWDVLGFLDDNFNRHGQPFCGARIISDADWLADNPDTSVAVAIADTYQRERMIERIRGMVSADAFATLIHPSTWLATDVVIGQGVVIYPGVLINSAAKVGNHVIINMRSSVGHDAVINDFVTIAPGVSISGTVTLHKGVDVGTNAAVLQRLTVGEYTRVGAGAVVIRDVPDNVTCVGVPARIVRIRQPSPGRQTKEQSGPLVEDNLPL